MTANDEYRICGTCGKRYKPTTNYFFCSNSCSTVRFNKNHPWVHAYDSDGYYLGIMRKGIDDLCGLTTEPYEDS